MFPVSTEPAHVQDIKVLLVRWVMMMMMMSLVIFTQLRSSLLLGLLYSVSCAKGHIKIYERLKEVCNYTVRSLHLGEMAPAAGQKTQPNRRPAALSLISPRLSLFTCWLGPRYNERIFTGNAEFTLFGCFTVRDTRPNHPVARTTLSTDIMI